MTPAPRAFDSAASLSSAQRQLARFFVDAGSAPGDAMTEARMILCAALGIDHAAFVREADRTIGVQGAAATQRLAAFALRRAKHEPVSRILGRREFWGLDFSISPAVLDPRADTETLVEAAIAAMVARTDAPLRILDLGTGSGALLCALLVSFPQAFGLGIDVSEAACKVAAQNLDALGLASRGAIIRGDWTMALGGSFDVIVSNPPYIAREDIATLDREVRDYDPHLALDGGEDGLSAYRALVPTLPNLLASDGIAVFELGIGQASGVGDLFAAAGLTAISTRRDLAGIERAIVAKRG